MLTRSAAVLRGLLKPALGQATTTRHLVRGFCSPVKDTFQRLGVPFQEELLEDYAEIVKEIKLAQDAYRLSPDGEAKAEYIKLLTVLGYEVEAHKVLAESGWTYGLGPYNPQFLTRSLGEFFISRRRKGSYSALEIMFWLILLFSVNWESIIQMFGVEKLSLSLLGGIIEVEPVPKKDQGVKFKDIIGIDEYRSEVEELVDFLKRPNVYKEAGAKMHKGVLFSGKPGVGKTELARAMANEANCNFFYQSAAEFMDSIVGMGVVKIQKLFQKARETGPAIIFLDEIDSLAYDRRESTSQYAMNELNQILTEMDGFEKDSKIIVIAATNRPERLDKSIMRAGRFDKKIDIPLPDLKGRVQLLEHFSKKIKLAEQIDFRLLASRTTGMSGADIKNLVNIAVLHTILEKRNSTTQKDFEFAHDRMVMGVYRKNLVMEEHTKILTAYHEAGHTLMNLLTNPGMALHKVTILPVGQSLGHTAFSPMTEQNFFTEENLDCMLDVAMGGRIAEELVFGEKRLSTGCSQDLKQASQIANELVRNMGVFPNKSAPLHVAGEVKDMSETINEMTDAKRSLERTRKTLGDNRNKLEVLARALLEKETMSASEIKKLLAI